MAINKLESGTYTRFKTINGVMVEVFKVTETTAAETKPLESGKYYLMINGGEPEEPYNTEAEALEGL